MKLTCPECETVMRPKVPVAPGKKVKCPKCEHVFVARGDVDEAEEVEEVEEAPKKKPKAKEKDKPRPAKEEKPAPKKEAEEAYGVIKEEAPPKPAKPKKKRRDEDDDDEDEDEDEEDDGKPKINYGLDESIRDLRGPAIEKLREPATWLTFSGLVGAIGWLAFIVILIIPFAFPIDEEEKKDKRGNPIPKKDDGKTPAKKVNKFLVVWQTFDFNEVVEQPPALFWLIITGFFLLGAYSGLIAFGGIKFLNLESRAWGIASGIMALLPVSPGGLIFTLAFFVQWLLRQVEMDDGTDIYITGGLGVLLYLASIGLGVWTLIVANDEVVKTGYEYKGE